MTATDVDVVVVGLGAAGAAAALTAADAGARVLVVEKAGQGGGSTAASGGNLRLVADRDQAILHLGQVAGPGVTVAAAEMFVDGLVELPQWLVGLGAELEAHDEFSDQALDVARSGSIYAELPGGGGFGSRVKLRRRAGVTGGEALWQLLMDQVTRRAVDVRYDATAFGLDLDADRRVRGVVVSHGDRKETIRTTGGVVLASGGFSWDPGLLEDSLGVALPSMGPPGLSTGDGIRLAQSAGAALWHMNAVTARYGFSFDPDDSAYRSTPPDQGLFLVDQDGRRYVDETGVDGHSAALVMVVRDARSGQFRRLPSFLVFDERTRLAGPLGRQSSGQHRHREWSADNAAELDKGWIVRGESLADLAERIGVPAGALEATGARFDEAAAMGDDDLGRPRELMRALMPPYYAMKLWPVLLNTQGGPRRNERSEVLDATGRPIPGLYSAGELGSIWGQLYPGAVSIAEALIGGRIAAREAVARSRSKVAEPIGDPTGQGAER